MLRIIADSTCDISKEDARKMGIQIVPISVRFGDEEFLDGVEITHEEFYTRLAECDELPKTSQPSPDTFMKVFNEAVADGDDVLGIFISSDLSGTYQSACLAALFRLESQMLPGNGKFERTGLGSDRDCKESTNTAFNFLKANGNRISGSISTTMRDYIINYQDLQGIGMTGKLALPTLIALCSIALGRPTVSTLAVLGEISISGTILKVDELANSLQVCLDSGAKKVLLPITSAADLGTVPPELVGSFNLIFYSSAEDAVFKALGVE